MIKINYVLGALSILFFLGIGCGQAKQDAVTNVSESEVNKVVMPDILAKGIEAHGGLPQWQKMKSLSYSFAREEATEVQQIALDSRYSRISRSDAFELGYDGDQVWVTPNKAAFGKGSPRFYHNLLFYFYAMPFVLADPGINYEEVAPRTIDGKKYSGIKISYHDGVGDAPDDYYIAYFDDETGLLYLLLYTVTYYNGEPNDKYNALLYEDWTTDNGLQLVKKMSGYKFAADTLGDKRYERIFDDIKISETPLPASIFERPEGAEIDSLLVHD